MKAMASAAVFFVLALALVAIPLITEAKDMPKEEDLCIRICAGRKEPEHTVCRETCALSERGYAVLFEKFACRDKCAAQKGIAAPALKACEEGCEKEYAAKAAVITDACNKSCDKSKEIPPLIESCKKGCRAPASMNN